MSIELNGTNGITNTGAYTGDGLSIADGAPSGALRIDTSGNAGLGVAPSAWGGGYKAYQVNTTGIFASNGSSGTLFGHNYYYDGSNNRYLISSSASAYGQFSGQHKWYTVPSGTAGNPITFTEAMQLDAVGRLTTPYQPMASVYRNNTGLGWVAKDSIEIYNTAIVNVGNCYNTSTGIFTCPVNGKYRIMGAGLVGNGNGPVHIRPLLNGSLITPYSAHYNGASSGYYTMSAQYIVSCSANDQLSIHIYATDARYYSNDGYPFALFELIG